MTTFHPHDADNDATPGPALIEVRGTLKRYHKAEGRSFKTTMEGPSWELYREVVKEFGYEIALELFQENPYWIPPYHNRLDFKLNGDSICLMINYRDHVMLPEAQSIVGNVLRLDMTDPEKSPTIEDMDLTLARFIDLVANQKFTGFYNDVLSKLALPSTYEQLLATQELRLGAYVFTTVKDGK